MSKRMSVLLAVLVGVLGGALVAGSALIGASAQPGPASTSSTATSTAPAAGTGTGKACGFKRLPAQLRADLKAARALPVGERRPAVRRIVRDAKAGKYGEQAQRLVKNRPHLRTALRSKLPAELKADLKKMRQLPVEDRKAARKEIRKQALAGDYGTWVQQITERRKEHRAKCRAGSGG
jgi:hypothetical protein